MIEDGVYIIKQEFFELFEEKGCKFKNNKKESRPTFCCMKDNKIQGLYWAIPTSKITENKNMNRIYKYIEKEYKVNGKHLIIRNKQQLEKIKKKLKRILSYEEQNPNKLEQKISYIKNKLLNELS